MNMVEVESELGMFEYGESYFDGVREGKHRRGMAGKVVFGILKRGGKVYALAVADACSQTLLITLKVRIKADAVIYADNLILAVSSVKHRRVNHSRTLAGQCGQRFLNRSKRVFGTYNGVPREHFFLFLKERQFRFNHGALRQQLTLLPTWLDPHTVI